MVVINNSCFRIDILLYCDSNTQTVSYCRNIVPMGKDSLLKSRDLWQSQAQRGKRRGKNLKHRELRTKHKLLERVDKMYKYINKINSIELKNDVLCSVT